jgi:hypothetical protein
MFRQRVAIFTCAVNESQMLLQLKLIKNQLQQCYNLLSFKYEWYVLKETNCSS